MRIDCAAVLFDSDGVLVESDASVDRAWGAWCRRFGVDPAQVIPTVHGRLVGETVRAWLPEAQWDEGLTAIVELERADAATVTAIPGAAELLGSLAAERSLPFAIVTSGESVLAWARLRAAGIPTPDVVVTGDDVSRGKPDPGPYLLAAERLGVPIGQCVVVEDSSAGVASARNAGVAGVVGVGSRAAELDVTAAVPDLRSLVAAPGGLETR